MKILDLHSGLFKTALLECLNLQKLIVYVWLFYKSFFMHLCSLLSTLYKCHDVNMLEEPYFIYVLLFEISHKSWLS